MVTYMKNLCESPAKLQGNIYVLAGQPAFFFFFLSLKVPSADWANGTMRPLYLLRDTYPQLVAEIRGKTWKTDNLQGSKSQKDAWKADSWQGITGYIPQVGWLVARLT